MYAKTDSAPEARSQEEDHSERPPGIQSVIEQIMVFDEEIDIHTETQPASSKAEVRCKYCLSTKVKPNRWLIGCKSWWCEDCKRRFEPAKTFWKHIDWDEAKMIFHEIYAGKATLREVARKRGDGWNPMQIARLCEDFCKNSRSATEMVQEYNLRTSPFLSLDLTGIPVQNDDGARGISPQPKSRATRLPTLFAGDPLTTYGYGASVIKVPRVIKRNEQERILTEAYAKALRALVEDCPRLANVKMIICDPEPALIGAVKIVFPGRPIQVDIVHVIRKIDTEILPTRRNRISGERAWDALKLQIRGILKAPSKREFYLGLRELAKQRREWEHDEKMCKAVGLLKKYQMLLTTHFNYPDSPRTNNFEEHYIKRIKESIEARKMFGTAESAEHNLKSYINAMNFTSYHTSDTGLNGLSPIQLCGGNPNQHWVDAVYVNKKKRWRRRVRLKPSISTAGK